MYTIGKLARATGVSIRALRYYDELGLLTPAATTETGYRVYSEDNLLRLQQILMLKQLGFSLKRIAEVLGHAGALSGEAAWRTALGQQLAALRAEQERLRRLEQLLHTALTALRMKGSFQLDDIELFVRSLQPENQRQRDEFRRRVFTDDERHILEALPNFGSDDPRLEEWAALLRRVRDSLQEPPFSPQAQQLAAELVTYGRSVFAGDDALLDKYWQQIKPQPGDPAAVYGLDAEMMAYIEAIVGWYEAHGEGGADG
jgi:DNA-binding transcriptional MerR regulator